MRRHNLLIGLLAVAVLVAGLLLVPRQEELVTMLARDGLYEKASHELMRMRENGDERPHILMQIHVLRDRQGDVQGALAALESYLVLRPDDTVARERLAELLAQGEDVDRYLGVLEEGVRAGSNLDQAERILALARLHGRFDTEMRLLQVFASHRQASAAILTRLGARLSEMERWVEAIAVLGRVDKVAGASESQARLLLLDALLEAGRTDEAYAAAVRWTDGWRSPYLTAKVITRLAQSGASERAVSLAQRTIEVLPAATFPIADVLSRKGQAGISSRLISRWVEINGATAGGNQMRDYVYAARMAGDANGAFATLARLAQSGAAADVQARLAEELANAFGAGAIGPIRAMLAPGVLQDRPLLAAGLALLEGNRRLAEGHLAATDVSRLDLSGQQRWLSMVSQMEGRSQLLDRLGRLWLEKRLPPLLMKAYAEHAAGQGRGDVHDAVWAALQGRGCMTEPAKGCAPAPTLMRVRQ